LGAREPRRPLLAGQWLGDPLDRKAVPNELVEVGREQTVVGADLAAEAAVRGEPPSFLVVAAAGLPATRRIGVPAREARVQDREHEPAARSQGARDGGEPPRQVVYVGETEVAHDAVEHLVLEGVAGGHV